MEKLTVVKEVKTLADAKEWFDNNENSLMGFYTIGDDLPIKPLPQTGTPAQFGAIGDGITDDTQALIDWGVWAFAESKDLKFDSKAIYKISQSIEYEIKHPFTLDFKNAKIVRDYKDSESNPLSTTPAA